MNLEWAHKTSSQYGDYEIAKHGDYRYTIDESTAARFFLGVYNAGGIFFAREFGTVDEAKVRAQQIADALEGEG